MENIRKKLFAEADLSYKNFHGNLIPGYDKNKILGVRVPILRKLAKEMQSNGQTEKFLEILPHFYYEENQLHAILISNMQNYSQCINYIDNFLIYVDNWATCDLISPKVFAKNHKLLLPKIKEWLQSEHQYTVRFALKMLMSFYLDKNFHQEYLALAANVVRDEYYIKMMQAWYFATALAKQYSVTITYLQTKKLPLWVHRKTIQKACESYRITLEQKKYLKTLR